jgi:hypothetical protein
MVVVVAIATGCRHRMCALAVSVVMSPVPLRRSQRLPRGAVPRHPAVMAPVIPPRQPPPEHRPHPILVLARADIVGAPLARLGN